MQKESYFFDEVECKIVNEISECIWNEIHDQNVFTRIETNVDDFFKYRLITAMQSYFYDDISIRPNYFLHKYFSNSLFQTISYLPKLRAKIIHDAVYVNLMGQFVLDRNITNFELQIFRIFFTSYESHFTTYIELINTLNNNFKAGLLAPPAPQIILAPDKPEALQIKYEAFNHYLKKFEYNYPFNTTPFNFKYDMKTYLSYLKTEILDNIIILCLDRRKPYLNKLKNELHNNKQYAYTSQQTIDEWLGKFNIKSEEDIKIGKTNNELFSILTADAPKFEDEFEENFNKDTRDIQTDFYNFYYGFYLDVAIDFINEQIKEHSPASTTSTDGKQMPPQPLPPKLKTNLTVPQLAYLFKMLMDINPPIFDIKSNKELYQFIEANFTTKGKVDAGPTVGKLNNLYSDVDKSTGNFWADKLAKMLQDARKI